jgi:hypothetical protein
VRYRFEQLALHRISLGVLADNPRAVELYKHMCVTLCARSGERGLSARRARSGFVEEATFRKKNWQVRWVLRLLTSSKLTRTPRGRQDSKWGSMVYMDILHVEWLAMHDATRAGFVEPSMDCNVRTDGEHVRLAMGY